MSARPKHITLAANVWLPKCSIQKQCFLLCKGSLGSNSQATGDLFCAYLLHPLKKKKGACLPYCVTSVPSPEFVLPSAVFARHSLFLSWYLKILLELIA